MSGEQLGFDKIESASRDELTALQTQRLKSTLRHAYENTAFYREKFDQHGVHPSDFQCLEDIQKFPFTEKADLRNNYPFGMLAIPRNRIQRVHASSGTTGKPTVVCYSEADIEMWANVMARSIYAAGGRPGDMIHVAYGYGLFTGGLGAHYGAERLGCTVIPMSGGQTEKQATFIQDFNPDIIMVTPSYMQNIADELERQGCDIDKLNLRLGIFGAEPWTEAMRGNIENRLNIQALDIYGLSEIIGGGVAQECQETKDGPTIWEDHFYPEIISPDNGDVFEDGKEGELVFSSLTKEAMPIIRYRTRDLSRLLPGTARTMRRLDKITGRSDDMFIVRGVNVFPSQIEEQILKQQELSPHYQIEVFRVGNMDSVKVCVEPKRVMNKLNLEDSTKQLQQRIKTVVGISAQVVIAESHSIPRSEGKARRLIDHRNLHD